jgi:3'-5' exonuclease
LIATGIHTALFTKLMFQINDYVYFPFKKEHLHGKICSFSEKTQKFSIEFFDNAAGKYRKVAKAGKDLTLGSIDIEYQGRSQRNSNALATQDQELEEWVILQDDPRFEGYLPAVATALEVGLDIETLGYDASMGALHPLYGDIRLIQVYLPEYGVCLVWDLGQILKDGLFRSGDLQNQKGFYDLSLIPGGTALVGMLSNPNCKKYIHNASFELLWFHHCFGITLFNVIDSMILSQMFWAGMHRGLMSVGMTNSNSLKWLAFRLNMPLPDKQDQLWDYGFAVGNRQLNYGALDAKLTYKCGLELFRRMDLIGMVQCRDAEMRAIPSFAQMSYLGFPVNVDKVNGFVQQYQACVDRLKREWDDEFPGVSPTSGKQAAIAILERYDVNLTVVSKTTDKETDSIAYDVLAPYFEKYEILRTLASIGSISKGLKYLQSIQETMRPNAYGVISVYGQFKQLASPGSMGRSGCGGKAPWLQLQTPPKGGSIARTQGLPKLRSVFEVPDGYSMISFDLSGSHAQIARYMSQDPKLLEALARNIKVHYFTSQGILSAQGIDLQPREIMKIKDDLSHSLYEKICETYEFSKTVFYSSLNGGGATRIQGEFAGQDPPIFLPLETCQLLCEGNKQAYKTMFQFMYSLPVEAAKKNHIIPVWFDGDEPVYWGYYGGLKANKESATLIRPPGIPDHVKPKYVGQNKGKYSGYLPGSVRMYGELRSPDGGRYFLQKEPDKKGNYQCLLGDASSFTWQRLEKSPLCIALGELTEIFYDNPAWGAWVPSMLHDEIMVVFKSEYAEVIAPLVCDTVVKSMRIFIKDFTSEITDPMKTVKKSWSKN